MSGLRPAVLTSGGMIAVSAARSLAALGVEVHGVGHPSESVRRSRACASFTPLGERLGIGERYLEWLRDGAPRGAVILPCDDEGLELVARHRAQLEDWGYRAVEANDSTLLAMLDKERTYDLADAAGVPRPRTATVRTRADAERAAREFDYPCALKPLQSHLFAQHYGITQKVWQAATDDELLAAFDRMQAAGIDMLVTEIVPGGDDQFCSYYSYLDADGRPLFHFTKRKFRQWPVSFGLTCYQATCWQPEVAELGLRFFEGVGLRGVGNVEFKRDARDGSWKLIECNHRFTAANDLVRAAGIDIPHLAYARVVGLPDPPVDSYARGMRMWHPVQDVKAFRVLRGRGELTTRRWARSLMHRQHFPMWRLDDPMPTVDSVGSKVVQVARNRLSP